MATQISAKIDQLATKKVWGKYSLSALELIFFIIALLVAWQGHRIGLKGNWKFWAAILIILIGTCLG